MSKAAQGVFARGVLAVRRGGGTRGERRSSGK